MSTTKKHTKKKRLSVYRFFLDAASDGTVPPTLLPGCKKLGTERIPVCPSAISGEGILSEFYRSRKLLDRCLEAIALRNDLTLGRAVPPAVLKPDAYILQPHGTCRFCRIIQKLALAHLAKAFRQRLYPRHQYQKIPARGSASGSDRAPPGARHRTKRF